MHERRRRDLLAQIASAFADVPYPGDDAVVSADWATTEACRLFCGRDWTRLDGALLEARSADLLFVMPEGARFLLPAFLVASLEGLDGGGAGHAATVLFLFGNQSDPHRRRRLLSAMTPAQKAAVGGFLSFTCEGSDGDVPGPASALGDALVNLRSGAADRAP